MDFDRYIENERIKNDLQEKSSYYSCDDCDRDIFEGEEYYKYDGKYLCEDCIEERLKLEKENYKRIAGEDE